MKKKSYWLSISVFVLILIWTVYYYAMQYTGGFADLKDSIVCGIVGLICIVFIVKRTIDFLKNKKVGTIVVGGSPVGSIQYELIDRQFDCMAKYLSWDMLFKKSYYATARDELEKNKDSMNELEWIGKNL